MADTSYCEKYVEIHFFCPTLVGVIIAAKYLVALATLSADTRVLLSEVVCAGMSCFERDILADATTVLDNLKRERQLH